MGKCGGKGNKNAYILFCLEKQRTRTALSNMGFPELLEHCSGMWQDLGPCERERYVSMSKQYNPNRSIGGGGEDAAGKFNCSGRSLLAMEEDKRKKTFCEDFAMWDIARRVEKARDAGSLLQMRIHILSVNTWVECGNGQVFPSEFGLVIMTLRDGIVARYNQMIHPGTLPIGYKADAKIKSDSHHRIWLDNVELSRNYYTVVDHIRALVSAKADQGEVYAGKAANVMELMMERGIDPPKATLSASENQLLPLYVKPSERETITKAMSWLCDKAKVDFEFTFYGLHQLLWKLSEAAPLQLPVRLTLNMAEENLDADVFFYAKGVSCRYHESISNCHCAGGAASRLSFIMSDLCCKMYGVRPLQGGHVPAGIHDGVTFVSSSSNSSLSQDSWTRPELENAPSNSRGQFGKSHILKNLLRKVGPNSFEVTSDAVGRTVEIPASVLEVLNDAEREQLAKTAKPGCDQGDSTFYSAVDVTSK